MTETVDVIAVMALDANHAYHWRREGADNTWAEEHSINSEVARSAVSELIESVASYRNGESFNETDESWSGYAARRRKEQARVDAALDRVRGAA